MNPNVNHGVWGTLTSQCRFTRCNWSFSLVRDAGNQWLWRAGTRIRGKLCTSRSKEKNTLEKKKRENNLWNAGNILVKFIYPKCEVLLYRIWRSNFFLSHRLRVYINKISPHRPLREFHGLIQDLIRATAFFNTIKKTRWANLTLLLSIFKKNL